MSLNISLTKRFGRNCYSWKSVYFGFLYKVAKFRLPFLKHPVYICLSCKMCFWNFKRVEVKNYQCKIKNKDSFGIYIEFCTKLYKAIFNFQPQIFSMQVKCKKKHIFGNTEKKKRKRINRKSCFIVLCGIRYRFQNCLCFSSSIDSFWLLFFWKFGKKRHKKNENLKFSRKLYRTPKKYHEQKDFSIQFYICCKNFIKIGP